jgi:hypothetical protein
MLLAATTLVAIGATVWKLVFYRHPAFYLFLFKQAPAPTGSIGVWH